jgi:hypothetical protein
VLELLSGAKRRAELCREHQLASAVRADGRAHVLARAASRFQSPAQPDPPDPTRLAELERLVGRLTLEHEILQKATTISHRHAQGRGRSCRGAARTLPSASSAGPSGAHGAVTMAALEAVTRHRSRRRSSASSAPGRPAATGGSPPSYDVRASRSTRSIRRGSCARGASRDNAPRAALGRRSAPIPTRATRTWCRA